MLDINAIFERISQEKGLKTDLALAQFLGVSKSAVNQSRTKGTANLWTLIEACAGLDLNWILRGERTTAAPSTDTALRTLAQSGYRVTLEPLPAPQAPRSPSPGEGSHPHP